MSASEMMRNATEGGMTALGLFAQESYPVVPVGEIGTWVMGLALFLLILDRIKSLFWPNKTLGEEYVRRAELEEIKNKLENFVTRLELQRLEQQIINLGNDHKDLAKSTQTKYDDMCKSINELRVSIEQVRREVHIEINGAVERIITRILEQCHVRPHSKEE